MGAVAVESTVFASTPRALLQDEEPGWAEIRPAPASETRPIVAVPAARALDLAAPAEPSLGGVLGWTLVVLALVAGLAVAARRLLRRSGLLSDEGLIRVVARRSLGARQDLFLVEVGGRTFLIGATREHLASLGEFARAEQSDPVPAKERPAGPAPLTEIADELAEIRRTVETWRV